MDYISQNHSKHLLMVHLIFVCKYRKELLVKYGEQIKNIFYDISEEKDLNIIEMEVDKNHIHLLVQYPPIKRLGLKVEQLELLEAFVMTQDNIDDLDRFSYYIAKEIKAGKISAADLKNSKQISRKPREKSNGVSACFESTTKHYRESTSELMLEALEGDLTL